MRISPSNNPEDALWAPWSTCAGGVQFSGGTGPSSASCRYTAYSEELLMPAVRDNGAQDGAAASFPTEGLAFYPFFLALVCL